MTFKIIDKETGKVLAECDNISALIETIEKMGEQYEPKWIDITPQRQGLGPMV